MPHFFILMDKDFYFKLNEYYNKFSEDLRLTRRHGIVEFNVTLRHILELLKPQDKIFDIGAGTGAYVHALTDLGYNTTGIELTSANIAKAKRNNINLIKGDAKCLDFIEDNTSNLTLLLGPIYHTHLSDDQLKIISEAKRITKNGGYIFIAYLLNDYAVMKHLFIDDNYIECKEMVDSNFIIENGNDLYTYHTLADIDRINEELNLRIFKRFSQEYITDLIRKDVNKMSEETFNAYIEFCYIRSCNTHMIGASTHIVDICKVNK